MSAVPIDFDNATTVVLATPFGPAALTVAELRDGISRASVLLQVDIASSAEGETTSERLLDANEAGLLLGVKPSWLLQKVRERRVSCVKLGRYIRFDVKKLIGELEQKPW